MNSVQIVNIQESKFIFNDSIFQNVIDSNIEMNNSIKDLPVSIIVINGAMRSGKSFFNNFFIRYLTQDNSEYLNNYFISKRGANVQTLGIWMFDKIFIHDNKAIILLDTQGIFDQELNQAMTVALISLSTLLSNYQIYNLDKRIQEDHLCNIAYFSAYSSLISNKTNDNNKLNDSLCFLIRDWQNFTDVTDIILCEQEAKTYKNDFFNNDKLDQNKIDTRNKINNTFTDITVKLCPHPGYFVTEQSFSGKISEIRPEFVMHIYHIIETILSELKPKKIGSDNLLCSELTNYMKQYISLYEDVKNKLPEPLTILEITEKICRENSKSKTILFYRNTMLKRLQKNDMTSEEIKEYHNECFNNTIIYFESLIVMGNIDTLKSDIINEIKCEYDNFLLMAKEKTFIYHITNHVNNLVNKFKKYFSIETLNMIKNIMICMCIIFILFAFPTIFEFVLSIIKYVIILSSVSFFLIQVNQTNSKIKTT